ncbi:GntR family transcriptional regulator [Vibrio maerlii]|uniref:GntR family transcriptional regulator n=1 Tax=Vibrio maerlii TaxID=2231648 RepID=UPI000E3D0C50|nr:GntR family transcriptional regulator [Vibrio maerlii]
MTKYEHVYHDVKDGIKQHRYKIGEQLPDGKTLAANYSCSEMTVKRALDMLVDEGLIARKRGAGTFVKRLPREMNFSHGSASFSHLLGTAANLETAGVKLTTKLISFEVIPADTSLASSLNIESDELVYKIKRVRIIDNKPTTIEETFMPISRIPGLKKQHAEQSIYSYIEGILGLKIHSATLSLSVRKADHEDAKLLAIPVQEPLVVVSQVVYLDNGKTFEFANIKHISESFNFTTHYVRENRKVGVV